MGLGRSLSPSCCMEHWGVWPYLTPPSLSHWDTGGSLFIFLPSPLSISNLLPREAGSGGSRIGLSALGQIEDIFGKSYSLWVIPACWALPGSVTAKETWLLTAAPAKWGMALPQPRLGNSPALESAAPWAQCPFKSPVRVRGERREAEEGGTQCTWGQSFLAGGCCGCE